MDALFKVKGAEVKCRAPLTREPPELQEGDVCPHSSFNRLLRDFLAADDRVSLAGLVLPWAQSP